MKTRFYYTLHELTGLTDSPIFSGTGMTSIISSLISGYSETDTTYTTKLAKDYLWPAMYDNYVAYVDVYSVNGIPQKPSITDDRVKALQKWLGGVLIEILNETKPYYEKLITLQTNYENDLLAKIESESFNRFNDTPQASNTGFDSDNYATTTNKTTSKTDGGTIMARLAEVRAEYRNYYKNWLKEFEKIMIWGD